MLTITHTRTDGTLIEGTERGDGTNTILMASGWRWSRALGSWFVPQSRDRAVKVRTIRATAAALREAGHDVELSIDDTARPTADVEADKIARQDERVEALAAKADRKTGAADAAYARHEAAVNRLPDGGEPVKIGHHSEGRHRRAISRAWSTLGTAVEAQREAEDAQTAATTATATTGARYSPVTVGNRIETLAAELRRLERRLTGPVLDPDTGYRSATEQEKAARARRLEPVIAETRDKLAYWEGVRAEQVATGVATDYGRHNVAKGDGVKIGGYWRRVARANAKTVSVETDYSWTDRAPWHSVTDHRTAAQLATASARAAE